MLEEAFKKRWGMSIGDAEKQLRTLYAEINRTKFKSKLSEKVFIKISLETKGKASTNRLSAFGDSIFFHPFMANPKEYREIMTHEMCHLAVDGDHGPNFEAKLKEIGAGEPWLDTELNQCADWVRRDKISSEWVSHAMELLKISPNLQWIDARREIAGRLGCEVREFDDIVLTYYGESFKDLWLREQSTESGS